MPTTPDTYLLGEDITAMVFGVDGVILDSAPAAAAAWKSVLDPLLREYSALHETTFRPFEVPADYVRFMYGKPRPDGVPGFLASRDISLTYDDMRGLAGRQEELFLAEARRHGVAPFASTVAVVRAARRGGLLTAAVSGDPYAVELLARVGVADMFDVRLDALDAPGTWRPGHSERVLYLEAARRLETAPGRTAVVENCPDGVAGAVRGGFGAVIGVDRIGRPDTLRGHGATAVLTDLSDLHLDGPGRRLRRGPSMKTWLVTYEGADAAHERVREALCTLGNGYFATRGAAPEVPADDVHYPGTYIAGCYDRLPSQVGGRTVVNEDLVNAPNWLPLTFRAEGGEWCALEPSSLLDFRQELDLRRGLLTRRYRHCRCRRPHRRRRTAAARLDGRPAPRGRADHDPGRELVRFVGSAFRSRRAGHELRRGALPGPGRTSPADPVDRCRGRPDLARRRDGHLGDAAGIGRPDDDPCARRRAPRAPARNRTGSPSTWPSTCSRASR